MTHRPYIWMHEGNADSHVTDFRESEARRMVDTLRRIKVSGVTSITGITIDRVHSSIELRPMHLRSLERSREQGMFSLL
jgi:hypothetical protein